MANETGPVAFLLKTPSGRVDLRWTKPEPGTYFDLQITPLYAHPLPTPSGELREHVRRLRELRRLYTGKQTRFELMPHHTAALDAAIAALAAQGQQTGERE